MRSLRNSWTITKLTFWVLWQDKELLLFPLIGSVAATAYTVLIIVPSGFVEALLQDSEGTITLALSDGAALVFGFALYFGLAFISTFFNVCVVYTTKVRFGGGDATFAQSLGFALKRIHRVVQWALLSATVGILLRSLEGAGGRRRGVNIFLILARSIFGVAWSVVSTFVVPAMVYEDISPWTAIRRSTAAVGRTWGDYVVLKIGLAPIHIIVFLVVGFFALVVAGAGVLSGIYAPVGLGIAGFLIVCAHVLLQVTNTIYTTALYVYADTGALPRYFLGAPLAQAFASEPPSGRFANDS